MMQPGESKAFHGLINTFTRVRTAGSSLRLRHFTVQRPIRLTWTRLLEQRIGLSRTDLCQKADSRMTRRTSPGPSSATLFPWHGLSKVCTQSLEIGNG